MEHTYLQWNLVNWITIFLMATLGYLALGAIAQAARKFKGSANTDA